MQGQVRLQCYFEDERQMVLLRRTEGIADLLRKLREQFDADEGGLIVKYEEGTFFSVGPAHTSASGLSTWCAPSG